MEDVRTKAAAAFVGIVDEAELAVRMCEANYSLVRPDGMSGAEALDAMEPDVKAGWLRAAQAAMLYFKETFAQAKPVN